MGEATTRQAALLLAVAVGSAGMVLFPSYWPLVAVAVGGILLLPQIAAIAKRS